MAPARRTWTYDLEELYRDQDPDLVVDVLAQLICWLDSDGTQNCHRFELREHTRKGSVDHQLTVSWDVVRLAKHDARLERDIARFRAGKTLTIEDRAKYAAYGLAMVAISCILQRRVAKMNFFQAPDLLLDTTLSPIRGVEVAGRTSKGYTALNQVLDGTSDTRGKRAQLREREDVIEAYLSVWCCQPLVSVWEKVKP